MGSCYPRAFGFVGVHLKLNITLMLKHVNNLKNRFTGLYRIIIFNKYLGMKCPTTYYMDQSIYI